MLTVELYNPETSDMAERLYHVLKEDGDTFASLLWQYVDLPSCREWVRSFDNPEQRKLFILFHKEVYEGEWNIIGCVWLDGLVEGHRAIVSMAVTKPYRGYFSYMAAKEALRVGRSLFKYPSLYALTPFHNAGTLLRKLGFCQTRVMPNFAQKEGKPLTVFEYRLESEV